MLENKLPGVCKDTIKQREEGRRREDTCDPEVALLRPGGRLILCLVEKGDPGTTVS